MPRNVVFRRVVLGVRRAEKEGRDRWIALLIEDDTAVLEGLLATRARD